MGFHVCEFCGDATSSGDVTLNFEGQDRAFVVPDMILHYVADHFYRPPFWFIGIVNSQRWAAEVPKKIERIGYLLPGPGMSGLLSPVGGESIGGGWVGRADFFLSLWRAIQAAEKAGRRVQTRGVK